MNRSFLQFVLRHADPDGSDADLLRRYLAHGDESAFAALVRRHGPMVWAVCRQSVPNRTDAEDVFQAVFLALAKSAKLVRRPEYLGSWLHGAAVRIAAKAKRGFVRRNNHERATAKSEADTPVSAGNWDEMLAAVHDEVAKLPRSLRAAFVLCELEGVDQAAAAERLGVKVNTLSGQLARARSLLLDQLTKRGVGAGLAVIGTAVAVPQALADKATGVIGLSPAASVIELASEITAMKLTKFKLLAAGFMLTCGLALTGVGLMPKAEAQPGAGAPPGGRPGAGGGPTGGPPGGLSGLGVPGGMMDGGEGGPGGGMPGGTPTARAAFEYLFVAKPGSLPEVAAVLRGKAMQNWEYTGPLDVDPTDPKNTPPKATAGFEGWTKDTRVVLVFKRHAPTGMGGGMGGSGMAAPGGMGGGMGSNPLAVMQGMAGGGGAASEKSGEVYQVYRLENAKAADAAKVLGEVFNGPNANPGAARVRVVAETNSNSIIVTKASPADLKTIEDLLKRVIDSKLVEPPKNPLQGAGTGSPEGGSSLGTPRPLNAKETWQELTVSSGKLTEEASRSVVDLLGTDTDVRWKAFLKTGTGSTAHYRGGESGLATIRKVIEAFDPKATFNVTPVKPGGAVGR